LSSDGVKPRSLSGGTGVHHPCLGRNPVENAYFCGRFGGYWG
jgi:hypothetical protein